MADEQKEQEQVVLVKFKADGSGAEVHTLGAVTPVHVAVAQSMLQQRFAEMAQMVESKIIE